MIPKSHPTRRCKGRGDEKARVIGIRVEEERELLTIETVGGYVFEIMRPPISEELEAELMRQVRAIVVEDESNGREEPPSAASQGPPP